MDVVENLEAAIAAVEEARSVPLSASCVVNRSEMLQLLDRVKVSFPNDLAKAISIQRDKEDIYALSARARLSAALDTRPGTPCTWSISASIASRASRCTTALATACRAARASARTSWTRTVSCTLGSASSLATRSTA